MSDTQTKLWIIYSITIVCLWATVQVKHDRGKWGGGLNKCVITAF